LFDHVLPAGAAPSTTQFCRICSKIAVRNQPIREGDDVRDLFAGRFRGETMARIGVPADPRCGRRPGRVRPVVPMVTVGTVTIRAVGAGRLLAIGTSRRPSGSGQGGPPHDAPHRKPWRRQTLAPAPTVRPQERARVLRGASGQIILAIAPAVANMCKRMVAFMEHDSHIVIEGASNVRDLGWPVATRPGTRRVVRSANLDQLSSHGRRAFGELRIAIVIDLRGKAEAAAAPVLEGTTRVHLPIEPTVAATLLDQRARGTLSVASAVEVMEHTYRRFIMDHAAVFAEVLQYAVGAKQRPILFHCAAGKDRTGVAAALILTALGVAPSVIMEDYLLSNRLYRPQNPGTADIPDAVRDVIVKVRPSYLEAAYAAMTEGWGGPEQYLASALGIGAREREAIGEAMR
jgi:protein-tyrosine phosphatase